MRFGRVGTCFAVAGAFVALRLAIGFAPIRLSPNSRADLILLLLIDLAATAALMLAQIGFVSGIASLKMRARSSALLMIPSALCVVGLSLILMRVSPAVLRAWSVPVMALRDLGLMTFAVSLGYTVSFIIREPKIMFPAGICAALVDFWGVNWGPLSHMLAKQPKIVESASVSMPTPVMHLPSAMIGMGDFLFLGLFFGVMYRFAMNVRGAFWLGFGLLTASMFLVKIGLLGPIPALVPMAIAILGMNVAHFKLKRAEWFAILYAGILVAAVMTVFVFLFHRR